MIELGESGQRLVSSRLCGITTRLSLFAVLECFITPVKDCAVYQSTSTVPNCVVRHGVDTGANPHRGWKLDY